MRYIPKYQQPTGKLPTYKGKPTTADKVGNYLKRSSQYIAESLPQFGMNIPFDVLRDLGVKIPVTMVSPTGYQGSYGTNQTTRQFAKHLVNNAGEAVAIDMGFGLLSKGFQVAAPYIKKQFNLLTNNLPFNSKINLSSNKSIGNINSEVKMLDNTELASIAKQGKSDAVNYLNNPIVQKTINNNHALQNRIFKVNRDPIIYSGENMQIPTKVTAAERVSYHGNKPVNISFDNRLIGTNELGKQWTDNIVINPYQSPNTAVNTTFHETLHNSGYGIFDRSIYDLKAEKLFGNNPYLSMGHEAAANTAELGKALNLHPGQPFPGVDKMKSLLNQGSNFYKQNVIDAAKLDNTRDYKRLWDSMTGKYFLAPLSIWAGTSTLSKKQGGKLIPKGQNGITIQKQDAIKSFIPKEKVNSILLTLQQQSNWKMFGQLNQPEQKQTQLSQGYRKTPQQKQQSEVRLVQQEKIQNYQKQKVKEAKDLQHAIEVAPYVIPGIGQAMWAGKAVDVATSWASKGKYKSWGNMFDQKTGSGEFVGDLTNPGYYAGAFPKLLGKGIQSTSKYALQKAEPYLMGDKIIPMMSGYKPKQEFWNPFKKEITIKPKNNIEDLTKAKEFANKFGYNFPSNLERIAQSDKLSDMSIKGLMNRHNTFVRGVSTNWDEIEKKSPQILQHLKDKGIDYITNPKQAAEYMATHVPLETGYGRASLPGELLRDNKSAIYTSNSIPTAEGYTYGNGYIVKVKRPTDFTSLNRQDWINKNQLDYFEDNIPLLNIKNIRNKSVLNKYRPKIVDDSKSLLRTERKYIILDKDLEGLTTNQLHDFAKSKLPNYDIGAAFENFNWSLLKPGENREVFRSNYLKNYIKNFSKEESLTYNQKMKMMNLNNNSNYLQNMIDDLISSKTKNNTYINGQNEISEKEANELIDFYKNEIINNNNKLNELYNSNNAYAHYLHLGNQGDKILDVVSSKRITPEIWKNKSRAHTNTYSRGLSMGSYVLPTAGLYGLTQSKKQGGKLIPKAQAGLKWNQRLYNAIDPTLPEIDVQTVAGAGIATALGLNLRNKNKYPVEEAAWKKRLNLPYNKKYLPSNPNGSVRLPDNVASQIVVDTNFVKNRIANQRNQQKSYTETRGYESKALNDMLKVDQAHLDSLRKFYNTGKSVGLNEFGAWKDRDVIDPETGKYKENVVSPLNVLHNFTLYKNPKTKKPMYGDIYDFNWADVLVPGKPYEISGPVK